MKRIFVYAYNLELGGIERSLLGLLSAINPNEYKVDLFLAKHEGELFELIPKYVNILPEDLHYQALGIPIRQALARGFFFETLARGIAKLMNRALRTLRKDSALALEGFISHKWIIRFMRLQPIRYDMAVSFAMPYFYVLTKVNAVKKIGFVHTDYTSVHINSQLVWRMLRDIDCIASVSESVKASLLKSISIETSKTCVIENMLSPQIIHTLAADQHDDMPDDGSIRLLSVGRFGKAKNFDNIPDICRRLIEMGLNVKWYLIGFGDQEQLIRDNIAKASMEDRVIILGKKVNPYPYMKECDLYVQPSRFEGKAVTVMEAQTLGKLVVITNFPTAQSQLENGVDGVIVPLDNKGCAMGIAELLRDEKRMCSLIDTTASRDYSNAGEVQKLLSYVR